MECRTLMRIYKPSRRKCILVARITGLVASFFGHPERCSYALDGNLTSQFTTNKVKKIEVADLFDIKQNRGESLKSYLACFYNAIVRKGLRDGSFNDTLALRRLSSMEEILRAYLHPLRVQAAEPIERRLQASSTDTGAEFPQNFTPLTQKRTQILKEICHTSLLEFPPKVKRWVLGLDRDGWCDFYRAFSHSTKECWTLKTQLEKLI
ncbi:hypothetical protein CR513_03260, partial [Mucuna pruriens]